MDVEAISNLYCDTVAQLVNSLAPHINAYLVQSDAAKKQAEQDAKVRRKIGFRKLYMMIQSEIINSGYKTVTVEEFMRTLQGIIDRVRKEYEEVDIEEK